MRHVLTALASTSLFAVACSAPPPPAPAPTPAPSTLMSAQPATPATFVNRVWQTTPAGGAAPHYYVFLAEGTLVIASSTGSPMVGRWARAGEGLTMVEDGREYPTDIVALSADALHLRSHNPGAPVDIHLVAATGDTTPVTAALPSAGLWPPELPPAVSGTVAYRERMALPPDAEVEVWITDTSPGIVTMAILAQVSVPTAGKQVPVPFTLPVDPARVEPTHTYGLRAVIKSGGQTLFESREPVPVLTQGHPATVSLLLARAAG